MPMGPGAYDDICTDARQKARARGALLVIIGGERGEGFSCQATPADLATLPEILETVAAELRRSREHLLHESN